MEVEVLEGELSVADTLRGQTGHRTVWYYIDSWQEVNRGMVRIVLLLEPVMLALASVAAQVPALGVVQGWCSC